MSTDEQDRPAPANRLEPQVEGHQAKPYTYTWGGHESPQTEGTASQCQATEQTESGAGLQPSRSPWTPLLAIHQNLPPHHPHREPEQQGQGLRLLGFPWPACLKANAPSPDCQERHQGQEHTSLIPCLPSLSQ